LEAPISRRRRPFAGGIALTLAAAAAAVGLTRCGTNYPNNVHVWGAYGTDLELLGDTCEALDGGCFLSSDGGERAFGFGTITLGVRIDTGRAVLIRGTANPDVVGFQAGSRFQFEIDADQPSGGLTICGCATNVHETFWGQLFPPPGAGLMGDGGFEDGGMEPAAPPPDPTDSDAGTAPSSMGCGLNPGLSPGDWLTSVDGGIDTNVQYDSFTAYAVDQITLANPDATCSCHVPCTVTYQVTGHL
jgi:hypothetical protein